MTFVRSIQLLADKVPDNAGWPWSLPAVSALRTPLRLDERATILVGENGSGKSTIVEALAVALAWDETEHVRVMRGFLEAPSSYLHHLLGPGN
jgi:predicted ATPase